MNRKVGLRKRGYGLDSIEKVKYAPSRKPFSGGDMPFDSIEIFIDTQHEPIYLTIVNSELAYGRDGGGIS